MSETPDRPRTVGAAFLCWVAAAIVLTAAGLLMMTFPPTAHRVAGALFVAIGLALGFLAGRARRRDPRFARAALGLATAAVAFVALVVLFLPLPVGGVGLLALAALALIAGSVLNQRATSQQWLHAEGDT